MRVSVVIVALNEAERIARCVTSAWEAGADEVLVGDGGSTDGTADHGRSLGAEVITSRAGRAAQQNAAAALAEGDVLLFLHADNALANDSLQQLRRRLQPPYVWGAFRQHIDAAGLRFRLLEWGNAQRVRWWRTAFGDQAIFVRRAVFEQLGGFADVPLMEDVLLSRQLRRLSRPLLLDAPLTVSARRWQRHGVVRQTLRNWTLLAAHAAGVPPQRLARFYPRK